MYRPLLSQLSGSRLALCSRRICRKTVKDPELLVQVPDADSLAVAETILRAGSAQFSSSAYLLLVKAGIQTHLKGDQAVSSVGDGMWACHDLNLMGDSLLLQGCTGLLEKAKKLVSRVEDRYMLFVCEQAKLERMSSKNTAETSMDMVRAHFTVDVDVWKPCMILPRAQHAPQ